MTFSGSAGQLATVKLTNSPWTTYGVGVTLYSTDGSTVLVSTFSTNPSFNLSQVTLPNNGTYTILIDPSGPIGAASITVAVTSP